MDMEWSESRYEQREERDDRDDSPNRTKDKKKSSRGEEKDHRIKERERSKRSGDDVLKEREKEAKDAEKERGSGRERRKDDRDERDKERSRDSKVREKDHEREKNREKERERDRDRKDRVKEKDREKERDVEKDSERGRDKERAKEKNKDRDKERDRAREKEREREKHRDKDKGKENYKDIDKEKEKAKEKIKEKEREADQDKEKSRDRVSRKSVEEDYEWGKDGGKDDKTKLDDNNKDRDARQGKASHYSDGEQIADDIAHKAHLTSSELGERILKMKEERSKKKTEDSEILAWVGRSRKIEEKKNAEKEKALQLSKIFEEQDNIVQEDSEDEGTRTTQHHNLGGVKVLHGIDKVLEGGAVVLTLKDQNILADGDVNEEIDMLENVEIGEQKRRDEAYKAAKKKVGIYDDKFNDDPYTEKKMLPQYDDPSTDEGITIDERGRITSEAEKKLEELRKRLQGASTNTRFEDLNLPGKISSDYYTPEEMTQFKKPKKKKSLRKKDKLDIDALEAEAVSAGLGVGDLGSRNEAKRQAIKEEQDRAEAERRSNAYQLAFAKADEASKSLRLEQTLPVKSEEEENLVFADDEEDFHKAVERARKITLKKKEEKTASGPEAVALLAATMVNSQTADEEKPTGESQENKVVFTEMEEFVWGLQLEEEAQKPESEDVFMDEDEEPKASNDEIMDEAGGWTEVKETENDEKPGEEEEEIVPDEIIHEVAVGKGLSGALKLLKERGTLKETIDWGGRNMDKKKSKLVGIVDDDEPAQRVHQKKDGTRTSSSSHSRDFRKVYEEKDIHIERTDEYGRTLTPKEAFRIISHKFHGKGPGKMKQEKRMRQYQEELKLKQMKSSDTPSQSVERMREAQAQLKTPYLVLSGNVKPGQTSDPRSGFATVEKDLPGGLTPMLGDRKVEYYLGLKRKPEPANSGTPKKPKS